MLKIRLVTFNEVPNCWDITDPDLDKEIDEQLKEYVNEYVVNNIDNITAPGFYVEDFDVPSNLYMDSNKQFVVDICTGRSFNVWFESGVDFNDEMYQNWIFFKNKDNVWEEFKE